MLFGVSVRKMFAAFAIGADAETVPPSFLAFLSFRKKEANERQLPEKYSSAPRPFQRAAQNGRFPYEPPVFSCSATGAGGGAPCCQNAPLARSAFCFFSSGGKYPLNKQRRTRCSECGALRCVSCFICRCCGKRPHSRSRWRCLSTIPPAAPARRSPAAMRVRFRAERSVPYHRERRPPAPRPRGRR